MKDRTRFGGIFVAEGYDKYGNHKWSDTFHNIVTSTGIKHILSVAFAAGTQNTTWYMGLLASTAVTSTKTMATISQATECSNATRPAFVETLSTLSLTNSAAKSTFTINKDATTVEGAFLASSNDMNGTGGILMCAAPFTGGTKVGDSGDKIIVTYTFSGADDGA